MGVGECFYDKNMIMTPIFLGGVFGKILFLFRNHLNQLYGNTPIPGIKRDPEQKTR